MNPTEQARSIFASDRFAALAGINIAEVGSHESICTITLGEEHRNARGAAMGGALYTLADFAAAVAANSDCLDDGNLLWVSLNATIHYLAPALCDQLSVHCIPLKAGRTTALYQSIITNSHDGKTIAVVETTMIHI